MDGGNAAVAAGASSTNLLAQHDLHHTSFGDQGDLTEISRRLSFASSSSLEDEFEHDEQHVDEQPQQQLHRPTVHLSLIHI